MKWRNYKLAYLVKCEKLLTSTNLINFEDKISYIIIFCEFVLQSPQVGHDFQYGVGMYFTPTTYIEKKVQVTESF